MKEELTIILCNKVLFYEKNDTGKIKTHLKVG